MSISDGVRHPKVLVVEDEFIIALDLSETVKDMGFALEGPYADNEHAFVAIDRDMPDCAILDVHTADGEVYPLADALNDAGVPIIFHSGHVAPDDLSERYPEAQAVAKPCPPDKLIGMIHRAVMGRGTERLTHTEVGADGAPSAPCPEVS